MNWRAYYQQVTGSCRRGFGEQLSFQLLVLLSWPYGIVMRLRAAAYRFGLLPSRRLPRPVIAVGNLVMGGTGKTPMTAFLAAYYISRGKKVAVLTRGYGGSLEGQVAVVADGCRRLLTPAEAGDEPCLLADSIAGLIVVMGSDRYSAGQLAMERFSPDIFLLDDGFQHLRLQRDLNILMISAAAPWGNGKVFPAGPLREPLAAAGRADIAVLTRADDGAQCPTGLPSALPVLRSRHQLTGYRVAGAPEQHSFSELAGRQGLAFAGIADPAAFFAALEQVGVNLVATLEFPDHCQFGDEEVAALAMLRRQTKPDYLITTGKDAVKIYNWVNSDQLLVVDLALTFDNLPLLADELDKFS